MKYLLFSILELSSFFALSQIGGNSAYSFLQLPASAHVASLGGRNISLMSNEPSFVFENPALMSDSTQFQPLLSTNRLLADVLAGSVGLGFSKKTYGNFFVGMIFFNYGTFQRFDELGNWQGNFHASDYSLYLAYSRPFRSDSLLTYGFAAKPIFSQYDTYSSFAIAFDAGLRYYLPEHLWTLAVAIKNIGAMIKPYYDNQNERINASVEFGVSKKLKHAPFCISVTFMNLNNWDLSAYKDITIIDRDTSRKPTRAELWLEEGLRHVVVATDILLLKNVYVALGYNFQRRKELGTHTRMSTTGLSWGFGIKLYRFQFHYARSAYHLALTTNTISLSSRISDWYKKKN